MESNLKRRAKRYESYRAKAGLEKRIGKVAIKTEARANRKKNNWHNFDDYKN